MRVFVVSMASGLLLLAATGASVAGDETTCADVKKAMTGLGASSSADELAGNLGTTTEYVRKCQVYLKGDGEAENIPAPKPAAESAK